MDIRIPYVLYHNKKIDFLFTGIPNEYRPDHLRTVSEGKDSGIA